MGLRGKKSRRKATIKITKGARKRTKRVEIKNPVLQKHWDKSKTLKENLKTLGLAYDSNSAVSMDVEPKINRKDVKNENISDAMKEEKSIAVISEFEEQAANGKKLERHIAPGEAKFLMTLISKHKTNYKAMSRDKENTHQHTPKQLKRKCEALLKSPLLHKYKETYPELVIEEMETS